MWKSQVMSIEWEFWVVYSFDVYDKFNSLQTKRLDYVVQVYDNNIFVVLDSSQVFIYTCYSHCFNRIYDINPSWLNN